MLNIPTHVTKQKMIQTQVRPYIHCTFA